MLLSFPTFLTWEKSEVNLINNYISNACDAHLRWVVMSLRMEVTRCLAFSTHISKFSYSHSLAVINIAYSFSNQQLGYSNALVDL